MCYGILRQKLYVVIILSYESYNYYLLLSKMENLNCYLNKIDIVKLEFNS